MRWLEGFVIDWAIPLTVVGSLIAAVALMISIGRDLKRLRVV